MLATLASSPSRDRAWLQMSAPDATRHLHQKKGPHSGGPGSGSAFESRQEKRSGLAASGALPLASGFTIRSPGAGRHRNFLAACRLDGGRNSTMSPGDT